MFLRIFGLTVTFDLQTSKYKHIIYIPFLIMFESLCKLYTDQCTYACRWTGGHYLKHNIFGSVWQRHVVSTILKVSISMFNYFSHFWRNCSKTTRSQDLHLTLSALVVNSLSQLSHYHPSWLWNKWIVQFTSGLMLMRLCLVNYT